MKKLMFTLIAACLALMMALTSCGSSDNPPAGTNAGTTPGSTTAPETTNGEDETEAPTTTDTDTDTPDEPDAPEIEVGDVINYKMAYYLEEARSDGLLTDKFLQNVSNDFSRLDDEIFVNDEDIYQLFWQGGAVGNTLTIPLEVAKAGTYAVKIELYCGQDFGIFDVYFNEQKLTAGTAGLDSYQPAEETGAFSFDLGLCVLDAGENELIFRVKGKNEFSTNYAFAIRTVQLTVNSFDTTPIERPEDPDDPSTPEDPRDEVTYQAGFLLDETKAANEGEDLFVQDLSDGFTRYDSEEGMDPTHTFQLFWGGVEVGDTLTLTIDVKEGGVYDLGLTSFHGGDFGIFEIYVNDERICTDYDLWGSGNIDERILENVTFTEGENTIVIRSAGKNEASNGYVFALTQIALITPEAE